MSSQTMPKKKKSTNVQPITLDMEKAMVDKFLAKYERASKRGSTTLRTIPQEQRQAITDANVSYWKGVTKAIKWLRAVNQQRKS